jgi:hypothetical protein
MVHMEKSGEERKQGKHKINLIIISSMTLSITDLRHYKLSKKYYRSAKLRDYNNHKHGQCSKSI